MGIDGPAATREQVPFANRNFGVPWPAVRPPIMAPKAKLLCLPYSPTLSHVSRLLSVAGVLRSWGTDVIFAGSGKEMAHVVAEGFPTKSIWEPKQEELFGAIRARKLNFVSREVLRRMVRVDLELFAEVQPQAVVTDGRLSAMISTQLASLPHGAIVNASSTRFRSIPYTPFFATPGRWVPQARPALVSLECHLFDLFMGAFRSVAKECGVPGATTPTDCLTAKDLTLIPDLPEFFPTRHLPDSYLYVGPLTWRPPDGALPRINFPEEGTEHPRLYITFGTTGDTAILRAARNVMAGSSYRVVITTAGQAPDLAPVENRVQVVDYADGDDLCEQANLVICHGGNGTIYQALRHGTPIIGIPFIPDQEYNMRRVEKLGLGRVLTLRQFTEDPRSLVRMVGALLEDRDTLARCRMFGDKIKMSSGPERAAKLVSTRLL